MTLQASALAQVDALTAIHQELATRSEYDDLSDLEPELASLAVRLQAAVDRFATSGSTYGQDADRSREQPDHVRVPKLLAILHALRDDINDGWMQSAAELLHAETFADFMSMATELNGKGYKDAAAVVAGAALEHHLRLMCTKSDIDTATASGRPKQADAMNADLAKASAYSVLVQKQVTSWLGLRNAAAHGEYGGFSQHDVSLMVSGVESFITKNPA
jgi:hypothetical protein